MMLSAITLLSILLLQGARGAKSEATNPFAGHPPFDCAPATARYLPGDYYFCEGNRALRRGKAQSAIAHFETSAGWGDKRSMFNMGLVYFRGMGIEVDKPLGLAWLALAAERPDSQMEREVLVVDLRSVDPAVRAEADAHWNQLKLKYADKVALARAQYRYEHATRTLRSATDRDPSMSVWVSRLTPSSNGHDAANNGDMISGALGSGIQTMRSMDEAAEQTILRPRKGSKGRVTSGPFIPKYDSKSAEKPKADED